MPKYRVVLDVNKTYWLWVTAPSKNAAITAVYNMQTTDIYEQGTLLDVDVGNVTVHEVEEEDDVE